MDSTFAPNSAGKSSAKGKLAFGRNSSGGVQEWYILGKDEGIDGDNTIIFAASSLMKNHWFNNASDNDNPDLSGLGVTYPDDTNISYIYLVRANHYGVSDLRKKWWSWLKIISILHQQNRA